VAVLWLQILLHLARELFEDTTKLEVVMTKVMQESMELIPCQNCSVLLLDKHHSKKQVSPFSPGLCGLLGLSVCVFSL